MRASVRPCVRLSVRPSHKPFNIFFSNHTHIFLTLLACVQTNFEKFKFKMADLLPFLFAEIDKIFEFFFLKNQMCPGGAAQIFYVVQIYSLTPWHAFSQVSDYSNFKMADLSPFLSAQIDKIFDFFFFEQSNVPGRCCPNFLCCPNLFLNSVACL